MQTKKSLWRGLVSVLAVTVLAVCAALPAFATAGTTTPVTPVSIDIVDTVVMMEGADLADMSEMDFDPSTGNGTWYNFPGYNPDMLGVQYTITYSDGTTEKLYADQVYNKFNEWPVYALNQYDSTTNQTSWAGGNTYTGGLLLFWDNANNQPPISGSYTVELQPNPVASFAITGTRQMLDCEKVELPYWDETTQSDVFYMGYEAREAITELTITLADGPTLTFESIGEMEEYIQELTGDPERWLGWNNPQSPTNLWGAGSYPITMDFMGHTAGFTLEVLSNPVTAASITTTQKMMVEEGQLLYADNVGADLSMMTFTLTTADGTTDYTHEDVVYGKEIARWLQFDNNENFNFPGVDNGWGVGTYTCDGATLFGIPVTVDLPVICPERTVYTAAEFKAAVEDPDVTAVFLGADIDLTSVGTVTVPSNKIDNFLWIDTCAWDLTGNTTLLHLNTNVRVVIGVDHGKPSSNPDFEADTEFNSGSAPMFHVEGASALELTAGIYYNAGNLLTANTAGHVVLMGGMYEGYPNGNWTVKDMFELAELYTDEDTGITWWDPQLMMDVTMTGTLADGGVLGQDLAVTTPGVGADVTIAITNRSNSTMEELIVFLGYYFESEGIWYAVGDTMSWSSSAPFAPAANPETDLTELCLSNLTAGQTVTIQLTGTLPADKKGDGMAITTDVVVEQYNPNNDPDNPEDDYEWIGGRSAGVGAYLLDLNGAVDSDVTTGAGGAGSVGSGIVVSGPDAELIPSTYTEDALKKETANIMSTLLVGDYMDLVADGVISGETLENLFTVMAQDDLSVPFTTTVVLEPLAAGEVDADTQTAMQLQAADGTLYYFDLSLQLSAGAGEDAVVLGNVHQLTEELPVTIALPEQFRTGSWTFTVLREHNGTVEPIMFVNNGDGTLTLLTDRFSTYAIAAKAVETQPDPTPAPVAPAPEAPALPTSPKTGEGVLPCVLSVLGLISLVGVVVLRKKQF